MKNKINLVELLKDCPKGMELDCTMFDNVNFIGLQDSSFPIIIHTPDGCKFLTSFGCYYDSCYAKCVIFPKGKTTWEGFHRPFVDGDIIYNRLQKRICIYYLCKDKVPRIRGCRYNEFNTQFEKLEYPIPITIQDYRLATEKEKEKFFNTIINNGYRWNAETKTLEKIVPKFKIGDRIKHKITNFSYIITEIKDDYYILDEISLPHGFLPIETQDEYELVPNKFDINTLKTFDKVLVRLTNNCVWMPKFFFYYDTDPKIKCYPFVTTENVGYPQCIPYEGNEHLCRKTNNCDKFYRVWEK